MEKDIVYKKQVLVEEVARELINWSQQNPSYYNYEKEEEVENVGWPFENDGLGSDGNSFGAWLVGCDEWHNAVMALLEDVGEVLSCEAKEAVIDDVEHEVRLLCQGLL